MRERERAGTAGLLGSTESATSASDLGGRSVGPTELGGWVVGGPVCWVRQRAGTAGQWFVEKPGLLDRCRSVRELGEKWFGGEMVLVCWSGAGL
jgi:hypothetical protein